MKKEETSESKALEKESDARIEDIVEEIEVEDLTVDGICGVY